MDPGEMAQEDSSDTFKAAVIYPRVFIDLLRWNSGLKKNPLGTFRGWIKVFFKGLMMQWGRKKNFLSKWIFITIGFLKLWTKIQLVSPEFRFGLK